MISRDAPRESGPRHSILDIAPLELECLSVLWPMGEGTVHQIHQQLCLARPRAYTTVLTIMDRMAQKGIVTRRKEGRAFLYRANLTAEEARGRAVEQIVSGFFDGSEEALAAHLAAHRASGQGGQTLSALPGPGPVSVDAPAKTSLESTQQNLDETLL